MSNINEQSSWKNVLLGSRRDSKSTIEEAEVKRKVSSSQIAGIVLECFSVVAVAVIAGILRFSEVLPVIGRNITDAVCKNLNRYSYTLNHDVFILSDVAFYCCFILIPIFTIIVFEILKNFTDKKNKKTLLITTSFYLPTFVRRIVRFSSTFFLVACLTSLIVDILKVIVEEPRPHLLTVHPSVCQISVNMDFGKVIVTSFPSFRATLSTYSALFCIIYVHSMLKCSGTYSLEPIITSVYLLLGLLTSFQRIVTNNSHWQDIIGGFIIGIPIACYVSIFLLKNFHENPVQAEQDPLDTNKILPRVSLRHTPKAFTGDASERVSYQSAEDLEPQFSFLKMYEREHRHRPLSY